MVNNEEHSTNIIKYNNAPDRKSEGELSKNRKMINRHISVYMCYCEGRRIDEIARAFNISKRTVFRDIKWSREKLPSDILREARNDAIFDSIRRRAILWTRFKKLSGMDISTNHLVSVSKHILELDKKIIEWKGSAVDSELAGSIFDPNNLDDVLTALDNILKHKTDRELDEIIEQCSKRLE